ncbi:MAG: type II toxin-antitoxin system PemK/MazF family toxin [Acidimicrobiales bacterium]
MPGETADEQHRPLALTHRDVAKCGEPVGREQAGRRPPVVLSADSLNDSRSGVVIVVPSTTRRLELPAHRARPEGVRAR